MGPQVQAASARSAGDRMAARHADQAAVGRERALERLREAFPGDGTEPRFLLRDNDAIYGETFEECVRSLGLTQILTATQSPWQNAYVERVIGKIRRECLDHILPMGERHLLRTLHDFMD